MLVLNTVNKKIKMIFEEGWMVVAILRLPLYLFSLDEKLCIKMYKENIQTSKPKYLSFFLTNYSLWPKILHLKV